MQNVNSNDMKWNSALVENRQETSPPAGSDSLAAILAHQSQQHSSS